MAFLNKEQILEVDDTEYDVVPCPEWGGDVRLKSIKGRQRDEYEQSLIIERGGNRSMNLRNARAKLIVLCAVDEHGALLFNPDDLNALGRKNAKPLDRLFDACRKLAGLSEDDVEKLTEDFGAARSDEGTSV
jgi:hypothetical protein